MQAVPITIAYVAELLPIQKGPRSDVSEHIALVRCKHVGEALHDRVIDFAHMPMKATIAVNVLGPGSGNCFKYFFKCCHGVCITSMSGSCGCLMMKSAPIVYP